MSEIIPSVNKVKFIITPINNKHSKHMILYEKICDKGNYATFIPHILNENFTAFFDYSEFNRNFELYLKNGQTFITDEGNGNYKIYSKNYRLLKNLEKL